MAFGDASERAFEAGRELAARLRRDVCLLHVSQLADLNPEMGNVYAVETRADFEQAARYLEEHAETIDSAKTMLRQGEPGGEILAAIEEAHPCLVVMATHGRTGIERFALGSVAEHVIRRSATPVLSLWASKAA
jgi:nucleotide-binding universal stress UspA family protein